MMGSSTTAANAPTNQSVLATSNPQQAYTGAANLVALNPGTLGTVGGSQAHLNMQPFLTISFCIALQGIFPSPT
jgi:microcystin-dependent protein